MIKSDVDGIIFDLDGTLWDSSQEVLRAWHEVASKNMDITKDITEEDLKGVMGLQIIEIGQRLFPYLSSKRQEEILMECCETECKYLKVNGGKLYDDLEETLRLLAEKYKLFIVSNCACGYIEAFLEAHKLEQYFSDFENPGRTRLSKGENIKLIIERNNLRNPVYVGDTEGDQKASRFAGVPFIYASYGFGYVDKYDYGIDKFKELIDMYI